MDKQKWGKKGDRSSNELGISTGQQTPQHLNSIDWLFTWFGGPSKFLATRSFCFALFPFRSSHTKVEKRLNAMGSNHRKCLIYFN